MKISELIKDLELMKGIYGDIEVKMFDGVNLNSVEMVEINCYKDAITLES